MFTTTEIENAQRRLASPEHQRALGHIATATAALVGDTDSETDFAAGLDATVVGQAAFASGTGPLLGKWIEDGRLHADNTVSHLLSKHLDHSRRRAAAFESDLTKLLDRLEPGGVTPTILKGTHTSRSYFPEPGSRPATDIDVLVKPTELETVQNALVDLGYRGTQAPDSRFRNEWYHPDSPAAPLSLDFTHAENSRAIDLHQSLERTIVAGTTARFCSRNSVFEPWPAWEGRVNVLRQPYLTAFLAVHACERIRETQLIRIVELCLVMKSDAGAALDWRELEQVLCENALDQFALPALKLAGDLVPDIVPSSIKEGLRTKSNRRMIRVLSRITPATVQTAGARSFDELLLYSRGPWRTGRALLFVLFPVRRLAALAKLPRIFVRRLRSILSGVFTIRIAENDPD